MKKYKVILSSRWGCEAIIEEVEVERETDKSIWVSGHRCAKASEYATYLDTWEQAKTALYNCQKYYTDGIANRLHRAKCALGNINRLSR